ncbi:carboxypeptidase-like regulatory domain-containing protein [Arenimonas alkanexedens]
MSTPPKNRLVLAIVLVLATCPAVTFAQDDADETSDYQDRIIDPGKLEPLPADDEEVFDATGLPRSWRLELVTSQIERGDTRYSESGASFGGFWETERWGNFSLDATLYRSNQGRTGDARWVGSATLWQRELAFDGGWRVDNGLGVLNTPLTPLQRDQYRFFLPSVPFSGLTSLWENRERGLSLIGSIGQAGVFAGSRIVAFDQADGNVGTIGAQWRWAPGWTGAASALVTDGRIIPDELGGGQFQDGRTEAILFSTAWAGRRDSANLHVQSSRGFLGDAFGAWADLASNRGRYAYNYGVFRLDPGLAWGALPINNDAQGFYFRTNYRHPRWTWSAGVDQIYSVSGDSFDGTFASAYLRYQARANLGIGGSVNVRDADAYTDFSSRWFVDRRSNWGQTRLQLDQASTSDREDWQVSLDQELPVRAGSRLSLSTAYATTEDDRIGTSRSYSLAALGGIELTDRLSLDGNVRWVRGSGPDSFRGTDINLSLNWRVGMHWWLSATAYHNRGEQRSPFQLDPLAPQDQFLRIPRERSLFLSLRYERQSGTPAFVMGGTPGAAAGSVRGSIFLDENDDGERAASELPAANVTVLLDGRFSVRTDSQGNFEFPRVAVGSHTITVVPDNLPLPWFLDEGNNARTIDVEVREAARVDIGARRQR